MKRHLIVALVASSVLATPALAAGAVKAFNGTWKGNGETITYEAHQTYMDMKDFERHVLCRRIWWFQDCA